MLCRQRNRGGQRSRVAVAHDFARHHKERLVVTVVNFWNPNRTVDDESRLVPTHDGALGAGQVGLEVIGVQLVVPEKLVRRAVEAVRPALEHRIDHGTRGVAVLRVIEIGLYVDLLYGVRRGHESHVDGRRGALFGRVRNAVEIDLVGGAEASHRHLRRGSVERTAELALLTRKEAGIHAGGQRRRQKRIAAHQGQILDLLRAHRLPHGGGGGLEQLVAGVYDYGLGKGADLEAGVHLELIAGVQFHPLAGEGLEPAGCDLYRVRAGRQKWYGVRSCVIGLSRYRRGSRGTPDFYGSIGHPGA